MNILLSGGSGFIGSYFIKRFLDVGADVDDTYAISMEFDGSYGIMIVDVVSRFAVRSLLVNMEEGQLKWDWSDNHIKLFNTNDKNWKKIKFSVGKAEDGYNPNIIEEMYIEEIETFIKAINKPQLWPNSLDDDIMILKTLHKLEGIS